MNTDIHKAATQYAGILNDEILVCHTGVIQAAMMKGTKRIHRLVTLPDYQGIGIGTKFVDFVARIYTNQGLRLNLITTTPALRFALERDNHWNLRRSGNVKPPGKSKLMDTDVWHNRNSLSCNRVTYSFDYVPDGINDSVANTPEMNSCKKPEQHQQQQLNLFDNGI